MIDSCDRRDLLQSLIGLVGDVGATLSDLRASAPTQSRAVVQLGRDDVRFAADEFLAGRLSAENLVQWAEVLHSAEEVVLDPADEGYLADALFELSTPELFGPMEEVVADLRKRDDTNA